SRSRTAEAGSLGALLPASARLPASRECPARRGLPRERAEAAQGVRVGLGRTAAAGATGPAMKRTLLLSLALLSFPAIATQLDCRVVGISDGDTLTCLTAERRQVKVRLAEIDTPESRQPYRTRAKQALSDLAFGRDVRLDVHETDRYGRTVARVYAGQVDVNAEMVRQGAAWVYRQYSRDKSLLVLEA